LRTRRSDTLAVAIVALVTPAVLGACAAMSTRQSADPVPAGSWQVSAGVDGVLYRDTEQQLTTPALQVEVGARRGVSENVDVGARVYIQGVEAGVKWRFYKRDWSIAVAPSLAASRTRDTQLTVDALYLFGHVPLLLGYRLSRSEMLNFGPRAMVGYFLPATGGHSQGASLGAFFNLDVRAGETWHLFPEAVVFHSVAGDVPIRGWIGQAGLGVAKDL
jgi:hypothetical protein